MRRITIAKGDGIGPEIMDATLKILKASEAPLEYDYIDMLEKRFIYQETQRVLQLGHGIPFVEIKFF